MVGGPADLEADYYMPDPAGTQVERDSRARETSGENREWVEGAGLGEDGGWGGGETIVLGVQNQESHKRKLFSIFKWYFIIWLQKIYQVFHMERI